MSLNREDKILLLKDLCARLPYGVKFLRESWNCEWDQEMSVIEVLEDIDKDGYINNTKVYTIEDIKPYLRPMSSMTEEEKEEFDEITLVHTLWGVVMDRIPKLIDWLNKKMFDYCGLIERGLAIEVTDKINPYKKS